MIEPEILMIDVGGQVLRTAIWRNGGQARPILFFNGIGANLEMVAPLGEMLEGRSDLIVFDMPGTTRDSIYIPYERRGKPYTLIDTAGIRRRKNITEKVEKFSIIKTLQAIEDSNVVVIVIDARDGIVEQDLHLIGFAIDSGRALVLAVNKWDGMTKDERESVRRELDRRLGFLNYANTHMISALHGTGVGELYQSIDDGYNSAMAKWSTNQLTCILEDCVAQHQPPMVGGNRIKLRYAHQGGSNPPVIVVHGNKTKVLLASYKRYLENTFRKVLKISGTPIRFEFKSGDNPFAIKNHKPAAKKGIDKNSDRVKGKPQQKSKKVYKKKGK